MRNISVGTALLVGVVAAALCAGTAAAGPPRIEPFSGSFVDTSTCPGITITSTFSGRDIILEETETSFTFHEDVVYTLTANDKTLTDNDHFTAQFDFVNGVFRYAGAVFNIQAPGVGKVLMDVGIIIFDENGNVIHQGGPHPAFFGDVQGLCDYLADP